MKFSYFSAFVLSLALPDNIATCSATVTIPP